MNRNENDAGQASVEADSVADTRPTASDTPTGEVGPMEGPRVRFGKITSAVTPAAT
jgi:hypothetical protein